jgi:hypothetical protein
MSLSGRHYSETAQFSHAFGGNAGSHLLLATQKGTLTSSVLYQQAFRRLP